MNKKRIVIIIIVCFIVYVFISNSLLSVTDYTIENAKLPDAFDGYKILQLSDLHSNSFGNDNDVLINKIDATKPDIVVLTGDMVNSDDKNIDTFLSFAKRIAQKYKTYFVDGNHEQNLSSNIGKELHSRMEEYGIDILSNRKVVIRRGNSKINLFGLKYSLKYYGNNENKVTKDVIEGYIGVANKNEFNLLITHNPNSFDAYADWGADLTLTGHIHGGLIRLPFVGGLYSPDRVFFPKYDDGVYIESDKKMIVNRGAGGNKGIRIFNNPEIVLITLKK